MGDGWRLTRNLAIGLATLCLLICLFGWMASRLVSCEPIGTPAPTGSR